MYLQYIQYVYTKVEYVLMWEKCEGEGWWSDESDFEMIEMRKAE